MGFDKVYDPNFSHLNLKICQQNSTKPAETSQEESRLRSAQHLYESHHLSKAQGNTFLLSLPNDAPNEPLCLVQSFCCTSGIQAGFTPN